MRLTLADLDRKCERLELRIAVADVCGEVATGTLLRHRWRRHQDRMIARENRIAWLRRHRRRRGGTT